MADAASPTPKPRVAIIGGGITGLSCAWALSQPENAAAEVTLYERWTHMGMDAFGQTLHLPEEGECRVDMPLRVFSPTYYEQLTALYRAVGIATEPCDHAATFFTHRGPDARPLFRYDNIEIGPFSVPVPKLSALKVVAEYLRFLAVATVSVLAGIPDNESFGQFLAARGFTAEFTDGMLIPALAAMLTCSSASVRAYPAGIIVEYVLLGALSRTRRVVGGAADVVKKLSTCVPDVRLGARIKQVLPLTQEDGVPHKRVRIIHEDGKSEDFDHVVFATQANQALELLGRAASKDVRRALTAFPYESSATVIHTDSSLMPPRREDWASVVFFLRSDSTDSARRGGATSATCPTADAIIAGSPKAADVSEHGVRSRPEATIWLNAAQKNLSHLRTPLFQTWNPHHEPTADRVLKRVVFDRPVLTVESVAGMKLLAEQQGRDGLWFCGSFSLYGMPLLDNGVAAGLRVAKAIGARLPWEKNARQRHSGVDSIDSIYRFTQSSKRRALCRLLFLPLVVSAVLLFSFLLALTWWLPPSLILSPFRGASQLA